MKVLNLVFLTLFISQLAWGQVFNWPPGRFLPPPQAGGIPYSTATNYVLLPAGTVGDCLKSGGTGAPSWGSCTGGGGSITSLNAQTGSTQVFSNDTNITMTSSNNTHALGWVSTLSLARGGSSNSLTAVNGGIVWSDAAKLNILIAGTSGQILTSGGAGIPTWSTPSASGITSLNAQTGATQVFANDTNILITSSNNTHSLSWGSTLSLARGGSGANLTAINGAIIYSNATSMVALPAGTSGQVLISSGAGAPVWTAPVPIASGGTNNASLAPVVGGVVYTDATKLNTLAAGTSGQFLQSAGGAAPVWASAVTAAITSLNAQTAATQVFANDTNIAITSSNNTHSLGWLSTLSLARGGTQANLTAANGGLVYSTASTLAITAAGTAGQIILSGGAGAPTFEGPLALNHGGSNASLTAANGGIPYSTATSLAILAAGTSGQFLRSGGAAAPTWATPTDTGITSLNAQTGTTQVFANDTNVIVTSSANTHALGWSGTLSLARGGSGANLTAANGGIVWSDAAKMQIIAAGTSGQILTSGGAGTPTWGSASGIGGYVQLAKTTTSASATSVTFSSISGSYQTLKIFVQAESLSVASFDAVLVQFNTDTGSNYDWAVTYGASNATTGAAGALAATSMNLGQLGGTLVTGNYGDILDLTIPNYASTVFYKETVSNTTNRQTTTFAIQDYAGAWKSTAAITSIKFFLNSGSGFVNGSTFILYGTN